MAWKIKNPIKGSARGSALLHIKRPPLAILLKLYLSFNTYLFPDNFILSYLAYIGIIFLFCFVFHHPQEFLSLQYFYQYITLYKHIYIYMSSLSKVPVYHICLQIFKQASYTLINNTSAYSNRFSNILIITHPPHSSPCSYSLGL